MNRFSRALFPKREVGFFNPLFYKIGKGVLLPGTLAEAEAAVGKSFI